MKALETIDLEKLMDKTAEEGKGRTIVWQDSESIAFLSRGRKRRMDFHVDPSDEVTLQLKGEQRLHYLTPEGDKKVVVLVVRVGELTNLLDASDGRGVPSVLRGGAIAARAQFGVDTRRDNTVGGGDRAPRPTRWSAQSRRISYALSWRDAGGE